MECGLYGLNLQVLRSENRKVPLTRERILCRNIDLLCNSTHTELKAKMDTLIGDKVQLFDGMIQKSAKFIEKPSEAA